MKQRGHKKSSSSKGELANGNATHTNGFKISNNKKAELNISNVTSSSSSTPTKSPKTSISFPNLNKLLNNGNVSDEEIKIKKSASFARHQLNIEQGRFDDPFVEFFLKIILVNLTHHF